MVGQFKVLTVFKGEEHPVNNEEVEVISAQEFNAKNKPISSVKGIISKHCYCPKINQFTGEVETPTVRVEGDEFIHLKIPANQ